jgi:hypothetical protein
MTVQLCSAARDEAQRDSPRCVLPKGHTGPHEGFDKTGDRVQYSDPAAKKPDA